MINNAEEKVSKFYNTVGWETKEGITEDAKQWEDLRECAKEYVSKCRLRVSKYIPDNGEKILDMASGPLQYKEYLEYSKNYKKRYCVDLSLKALDAAKEKIGDHGVFLHGSFFDIDFEQDFFDCAISLHTIFHIDKDRQEEAVRKLVSIIKLGRPVVIVYSNSETIYTLQIRIVKNILKKLIPTDILKKIKILLAGKKNENELREPGLYFFAHPITWWTNFSDVADIQIMPFRSFSSDVQKAIIPNNAFGKKLFGYLFNLEERFPSFFAKFFQYPIIILTKKVARK